MLIEDEGWLIEDEEGWSKAEAKSGWRCSYGVVSLQAIYFLRGSFLPFLPAARLGRLVIDSLVKFGEMLCWPLRVLANLP